MDKHTNKEDSITGLASHSAAFGVADGTSHHTLLPACSIVQALTWHIITRGQALEAGPNQVLILECLVKH